MAAQIKSWLILLWIKPTHTSQFHSASSNYAQKTTLLHFIKTVFQVYLLYFVKLLVMLPACEISSWDWYIKTVVNIADLFSWTATGWEDATGHRCSEYSWPGFLWYFFSLSFPVFLSSLREEFSYNQNDSLTATCLEVCDCIFLSSLTYSAQSF